MGKKCKQKAKERLLVLTILRDVVGIAAALAKIVAMLASPKDWVPKAGRVKTLLGLWKQFTPFPPRCQDENTWNCLLCPVCCRVGNWYNHHTAQQREQQLTDQQKPPGKRKCLQVLQHLQALAGANPWPRLNCPQRQIKNVCIIVQSSLICQDWLINLRRFF